MQLIPDVMQEKMFMRLLKLVLILSLIGCTSDIVIRDYIYDDRINGKWKSDKQKSIEWVRKHRNFNEKQIRKLESIFGKMVLEISDDTVIVTYEGDRNVEEGTIIGKDHDSIATIALDPVTKKPELRLIRVEDKNTYSIYIDTFDIREYFTRIE